MIKLTNTLLLGAIVLLLIIQLIDRARTPEQLQAVDLALRRSIAALAQCCALVEGVRKRLGVHCR